jgi:hypothetical protein
MLSFNRGSKVSVEGGVVWDLEDAEAEDLEVNHAKRLVVLLVCAVDICRSRDGLVNVFISSSSSKQSCSSEDKLISMGSEVALALKKFPNKEALEECLARVPAVLALFAAVSVVKLVRTFVGEARPDEEGDGGDCGLLGEVARAIRGGRLSQKALGTR